jgi:hypothetical protein
MGTNATERERALRWMASQLRWERILGRLREETGAETEAPIQRQAA